ncbi:MAG: Iron-sulfur clusters transporter atm1, mitochondrial [Chaenotheca gracillima]|nr:MAG: Iron-sulfur clusters transporter atm1, mitochondrial [Chaenotheca gracillima]
MALQEGEEFVAHPSNVVAYDMTRYPPLPYRLKSSSLRLQIPSLDLARFLPDTKFFQVMWSSGTWKALRNFSFAVRTWSRRTIWGDRLFLRFQGPTTILLQSRASRVSDVMSARDVNEVADAPPGVAQAAILEQPRAKQEAVEAEADRISATEGSSPTRKRPAQEVPTTMRYASVHRDGHVSIDSTRG